MWKQVKDLALIEGVSRQTIHRRIENGAYKRVMRTVGGHYRIWLDSEPKLVLYTRVSTSKQKASLDTQATLLKKAFPKGEIIYDIGSGFNFERRGFKTILERSLNGTPFIIVATNKDRITRSGYPLVKKIIELSGGEIRLLEEDNSSEEFDTESLISFITSFISSYYGKRSAKRRNSDNNEES